MSCATDEILIHSNIKSLLVRERYYRDTCQWQKLRDCYHPDASQTHIEITWYQGDINGFVRGSADMSARGTGAVHTICPIEVHLNGDKEQALTESTGSISIRFVYEGRQYDCVSYTRFISRLQIVDGQWKLLTLEAIYDRDNIVPVLPGAPADFHIAHETRESYKCISWLLARKGFKIKEDLPGGDYPASCEKLMREGFEWLNK
ncbi:hypothetical protein BO82DRAFT_433504 [Aspergillus uvarum CBS 121591]|uniref:SnoaL-like domain-containing protein n=1 Tax=Aspergillus uvarum CBS 121591 TaxID=1448315 RepID=A0A319C511_9EURO|nr:hypothetical protein BO82DRAFT_433504 [Aspergillus uvarum CBS 121591]PYH80325.1 hypothetical protein BO82DRAFT_433504 [Aspergillus uvarum CBS 121591]